MEGFEVIFAWMILPIVYKTIGCMNQEP